MKKIILFLVLIIALFSCNKNNEAINESSDVKKDVITEFTEYLKIEKNQILKKSVNKSFVISNAANPFDNIGYLHNVSLDHFDEDGGLQNYTISSTLLKANEDYGIICKLTEVELGSSLASMFGNIYFADYTYKSTFVNSINSISTIEKDILNAYFTEVDSIAAIDVRVELSKSLENFIFNNDVIPQETKDRLLRTFSIYRYSTYYWENYEFSSKSNLRAELSDIMDALAEHWATHADHPIGRFEDGASVNQYSSLVSMISYFSMP